MFMQRISQGSFDFSLLAASFSSAQASAAQALSMGWADEYGPSSQGFDDGFLASLAAMLSPPNEYGSLGLEQGFSQLGALAAALGLSGSFGPSSEVNAMRAQANVNRVSKPPPPKLAEGDDKFAVHQSCVSNVVGNPSNMNNSDHIALAINDVLKNSSEVRDGTSFKAMKPEDLKKKLKDEYGIDSELTKVKDKNGTEIAALKFSNGAVFADGAGDGKLDTGDYNFAGKVAEIEKKYGVSADELVKGMKDQKTRIDRYYPGAEVDLSGALQDGLQGTADRVKYQKEVEATRTELQKKYGFEVSPGVAEEVLAQKKLAAAYGVELGPEQLSAMAEQSSLFVDPAVQLLMQQLFASRLAGVDLGPMFRLGLGLSMS